MTETQPLPQTGTLAEDILSSLIVQHGLTALDPFERAYSIQSVKESLELIVKELELAYINTVGTLLDAGRRSSSSSSGSTYRLEEVTASVTVVDKQKLLRDEPELYERIARISASVFLKELGHSVLRTALIDKCGIEKVHAYDTVNIKDFDAAYPDPATIGWYRRAKPHTKEYRIVKDEGSTAETAEADA